MNALKKKVGELFMVGYAGSDPLEARNLIQQHRVGGIILFTRNIQNAAHARSVSTALQELRNEASDTPLFIAVDQEGGCVARITEGVTVFPGNMALGATRSEAFARQVGEVTARELSALGTNVNFAPVLDLSTNPRNPGLGARSFGADPQLASRLGAAMIEGMRKESVCATGKHFPGLGEAKVDSHDELPTVDLPRSRLERVELAPFRAAIAANVDFVMTAHCSFPALDDSSVPATLSHRMLTGLLREEMGFDGIVITDCLEMGAVEKRHPAHESAVLALQAGADVLLICHTPQKQIAAIDAIVRAVENGHVPEERVDESLARIRAVKQRIKPPNLTFDFSPQRELSEEIAARSITLIENENNLVPLRLDSSAALVLVTPLFEALTKVEETYQHSSAFLQEVNRFHPNAALHEIPVKPTSDETRNAVQKCAKADALIVLTYNLHLNPEQRECMQALLDLGNPAVVVAVRDPHDLACLSGAKARLATYSFRQCSLKALARVIFGEITAEGIFPVELQEI